MLIGLQGLGSTAPHPVMQVVIEGLCRDISPATENQVNKKISHEKETGVTWGFGRV